MLTMSVVDMHPDMKTVVVTEVERLVYRPHVAVKAQSVHTRVCLSHVSL